jgi:hypothetical protein
MDFLLWFNWIVSGANEGVVNIAVILYKKFLWLSMTLITNVKLAIEANALRKYTDIPIGTPSV